MTENGTEAPRRQTQTEFVREIMRTLVTRAPVGRVETGKISAPGNGPLAGQFLPELELARDPDETMDQWLARFDLAFAALFKKCLVYNHPEYRDELLHEALAELRNPEKVTT